MGEEVKSKLLVGRGFDAGVVEKGKNHQKPVYPWSTLADGGKEPYRPTW